MEEIFQSNGFIVKLIDEVHQTYRGVEGDCWSVTESMKELNQKESKILENYFSENIEISWADDRFVEVSNDLEIINRYISLCMKANLKFDILFCKTTKLLPEFYLDVENLKDQKFKFLGYDYAYPGGSFYSCVYNDLYSKRISELLDIKLNEYGLISFDEEIYEFIFRRKKLAAQSINEFEVGEFIIYKLWLYKGNIPI